MRTMVCNFCGSDTYETRQMDYLYSHEGKYLLVPNTPVEYCSTCGMIYYEAAVLKKIEQHFFAIHQHTETADSYISIPTKAYI
ncbi:MAG: type II toxin-antitoxin system MqsA family antitoxin [Candidatus Tectimicrobiota bacterium]